MKKIAMTALVFAVLTMSNISGETLYAGSGNNGGYGNTGENNTTAVLAGTGSSGGYGKNDEGKGGLVLAGSGNSGGYGHLDTSGRKKVVAEMIA